MRRKHFGNNLSVSLCLSLSLYLKTTSTAQYRKVGIGPSYTLVFFTRICCVFIKHAIGLTDGLPDASYIADYRLGVRVRSDKPQCSDYIPIAFGVVYTNNQSAATTCVARNFLHHTCGAPFHACTSQYASVHIVACYTISTRIIVLFYDVLSSKVFIM